VVFFIFRHNFLVLISSKNLVIVSIDFRSKKRKMDVAQRWDISEEIVYIVLKYLWFEIVSPVKNSDDRGLDFQIEFGEYDIKIQVKSSINYEKENNFLKYDLKVNNNNLLVKYNKENNKRAWILILIIIDKDLEEELVNIKEQEVITKCKIYWHKPTTETINKNTIQLQIPLENQITSKNLNNHIKEWIK